MIYKNIPEKFNKQFSAAGCYVECGGEILLLYRTDVGYEGNKWGLPGGMIDEGESESDAVIREIKEETGLEFLSNQVEYLAEVFVDLPAGRHGLPARNFIYHMFRTRITEKPEIKIDQNEHKAFKWVRPDEALKMNLVSGLDECIKMVYEV